MEVKLLGSWLLLKKQGLQSSSPRQVGYKSQSEVDITLMDCFRVEEDHHCSSSAY